MGFNPTRVSVLSGVVLAGACGAAVLTTLAANDAFSDEPGVVARFDISPIPFTGYGTVSPPDTANPPECQSPDDERPAPDLPPLPCRHELAEPEPGAIATAAQPAPTRIPGAGRRVIDNGAFRLTLEVVDDWYVNMRPEGGEFYVLDPTATEQHARDSDFPGGVIIHFTADEYRPLSELGPLPDQLIPDLHRHLERQPHNATFGAFTGAIWDAEPEEGLAKVIRAAFVRDGIVFQAKVNLGQGATPDQATADAEAATSILVSIIPY